MVEARRYRPVITAALSLAAIAIVFAAAGGRVPPTWVPATSDRVLALIPHLNVAIALAAMASILVGWRAIRRGRIQTHKRAMIGATLLFATFLVLYLYRLILLGGPTPFAGPEAVYRFVYLPLLAVHIGFAVLCIPLVFDALALALTVPTRELPRTRHPTVGRIAATLWLISFGLGIGVYLLLHWL